MKKKTIVFAKKYKSNQRNLINGKNKTLNNA